MITLTEEQNDCIASAIECIFTKKEAVFISGMAGTGKTTIANEIAERMYELGMNVYFTAATHTAANRLSKSLSSNDNVLTATTIHSFLKMRLVDTQFGKQIFEFSDDFEFPQNSLLIVDEASMLDRKLFNRIQQTCFPNVIFLGDSIQIPPVAENDGERVKVLTVNESEPPVIELPNKFELKTIHRQNQESALAKLCIYVRNEIMKGNGAYLYDNQDILIDKIQEFEQLDDDTIFLNLAASEVVPSILENEDTCFLAFGNPTIHAVQKHLPEWYIPGGNAITNGTVSVSIDGKKSVLFSNNSHIKIEDIDFKHLKKWGVDFDMITVEGQTFLVPSDQENFDTVYQTWIEAALYNSNITNTMSMETTKLFSKYGYEDINNDRLNNFMAGVTTLRESRVSTVHRAQGMEWKNVIIAFNNVMFAGKNLSKDKGIVKMDDHRKIICMKLFYTAISRAREAVIFCFGWKNDAYTPKRSYK